MKYVMTVLFVLFAGQVMANTVNLNDSTYGTICGADDRVVSDVSPIGRLVEEAQGGGGCTGTMIGPTCMVTAGHCRTVLKFAQFNVPLSDSETGKGNPPELVDEYPVIERVGLLSSDWAVIRLGPNAETGKLAGHVQGYYDVDFAQPASGTVLRITGYGRDKEPSKNLAQQTHTGPITSVGSGSLRYKIDTEPGNSGSALIDVKTQRVIGVHTNGGCGSFGNSNRGTSLYANPRFQSAVRKCLAAEE